MSLLPGLLGPLLLKGLLSLPMLVLVVLHQSVEVHVSGWVTAGIWMRTVGGWRQRVLLPVLRMMLIIRPNSWFEDASLSPVLKLRRKVKTVSDVLIGIVRFGWSQGTIIAFARPVLDNFTAWVHVAVTRQ